MTDQLTKNDAKIRRMTYIIESLVKADDYRKSGQGKHNQIDDFFDWARNELARVEDTAPDTKQTLDRINAVLGYDCTKTDDNMFKMLKDIVNQMLPGWSLVPNVGTVVKTDHPQTVLNPDEYFVVKNARDRGYPISGNSAFEVIGEKTCWFGLNGITPKPRAE